MSIRFAKLSPEEMEDAMKIAQRAAPVLRKAGARHVDVTHVLMDLQAVHFHIPLRLHEMAKCTDFNFAHDVAGIYRHLNRQTGKLEDFFVPRFARPEYEVADA